MHTQVVLINDVLCHDRATHRSLNGLTRTATVIEESSPWSVAVGVVAAKVHLLPLAPLSLAPASASDA